MNYIFILFVYGEFVEERKKNEKFHPISTIMIIIIIIQKIVKQTWTFEAFFLIKPTQYIYFRAEILPFFLQYNIINAFYDSWNKKKMEMEMEISKSILDLWWCSYSSSVYNAINRFLLEIVIVFFFLASFFFDKKSNITFLWFFFLLEEDIIIIQK